MTSDSHKLFSAMVDDQKFLLATRLNSTITYLASIVQRQGEAALLHHLAAILQQAQFKVEASAHAVCGEYTAGKAQRLFLFSHCPPQEDALARWEGLTTRLLTLAFYQETVGELPVNVTWFITTNQQGDESNLLFKLGVASQAVGCLYDPPASTTLTTPTLALGTKGLVRVSMEVRTTNSIHPASDGAILPNAAWRLLWALQSLKNVHEEILLEGFYDDLVPLEDEEVEFLRANLDDERILKQQFQTNSFLSHLHGFQLRYAYYLLPTFTITSIGSDPASAETHSLLPSHAWASLDIYLVPTQDPHDIFEKLRRYLDAQGFVDVQTTLLASREPRHTALHEPFTKLVLDAMHTTYGKQCAVLPLLPQPIIPALPQAKLPLLYTYLGPLTQQENDIVGGDKRGIQSLLYSMKFLALVMEGVAGHSRHT